MRRGDSPHTLRFHKDFSLVNALHFPHNLLHILQELDYPNQTYHHLQRKTAAALALAVHLAFRGQRD
ncbi:hypothetical protein D1872_325040 [compost metagenome]